MFVGGNPFDYNLTASSPCVDTGTSYFIWLNEVLVDMDSTQYHSFAPDMGCYESPYVTSVEGIDIFPNNYALYQNYPNPFNPSTIIEFDLPKTSEVSLKIFNILGEEVATLVSDRLSHGSYSYEWDASQYASGVYLYRLHAGDYVETRKMVLIR